MNNKLEKLVGPVQPGDLDDQDALEVVPAESLWLANFPTENTRAAYRRAVGDFIETMGITSPAALYSVTQAHVIAFRDELRDRGLSNASIANRLSVLSSLYKFLADKQLCKINPVSGVRRPTTGSGGLGSGKTPALTAKQVRAMLEAPDPETLQGLRDRAILHVYFFTGGRCSEPATLRVKDFRLDRDYWVLEFTTKGEKINTVAIHTECQIALRRYLDASGHDGDPQAPLFLAVKAGKNTGGPLTRGSFYKLFKKYAGLAGLPANITPHSARATFITQAYDAGLQGEDIQRTVGHSSITTTEGYNRAARRHRKSASFGVNY